MSKKYKISFSSAAAYQWKADFSTIKTVTGVRRMNASSKPRTVKTLQQTMEKPFVGPATASGVCAYQMRFSSDPPRILEPNAGLSIVLCLFSFIPKVGNAAIVVITILNLKSWDLL